MKSVVACISVDVTAVRPKNQADPMFFIVSDLLWTRKYNRGDHAMWMWQLDSGIFITDIIILLIMPITDNLFIFHLNV